MPSSGGCVRGIVRGLNYLFDCADSGRKRLLIMKVQNLKYWESFNNFFSKLMAFFSEVDPTTLPSGYEATLVFKDKNNPSPSIEKVWDFPKIIDKVLSQSYSLHFGV